MFIENLNLLQKTKPALRPKVSFEEEEKSFIDIASRPAKNDLPTLIVKQEGKELLLHSKYDPQKEAELFISSFEVEDVQKYESVFFYGVGLGYQIEAFFKRFGPKKFYLYEAQPEILRLYLENRSLKELPLTYLEDIYVEKDTDDTQKFAADFLAKVKNEVLFVILPSYQKIFAADYERFSKSFIEAVKNKRSSLFTNFNFQKRWTLNSLLNLPEVFATPNILHDAKRSFFTKKPAILVAAGPSLDEEIENLRWIKEKGLAYLFSVGSAINTLIEYDVFPDAACTYDPDYNNQFVFEKLKKRAISTIPLVFGSSVGFETLQNYPGKKLHLITGQDTVGRYFLKHQSGETLKIIPDASTIAIITFNLLVELGFDPIILVGQNLAYLEDKTYASGISYYEGKKAQKEGLIEIEDVKGDKTYTTEGFLRMKRELESYIELALKKKVRVINTTKGGAKIKGTEFKDLSEIIKKELGQKAVEPSWSEIKGGVYAEDYLQKKMQAMEKEMLAYESFFYQLEEILVKVEKTNSKGSREQLEKMFSRLDKTFKKLSKNDFYRVFLLPMNRVPFELLKQNVSAVRFEENLEQKAEVILKEFQRFILATAADYKTLKPLYLKTMAELKNTLAKDQDKAAVADN